MSGHHLRQVGFGTMALLRSLSTAAAMSGHHLRQVVFGTMALLRSLVILATYLLNPSVDGGGEDR